MTETDRGRAEPVWLSTDIAVRINRVLVEATGEPFYVRDDPLLESAIARPRHHFLRNRDDLLELACVLLFAIVRNHPFAQGNKRTGFIAALTFLNANGLDLIVPDDADLGRSIVAVIEDPSTEVAFRARLQAYLVAFPT